MEAEQPIVNSGALINNEIHYNRTSAEGQNEAIVLGFSSKVVNVRYGISFISEEQAQENLEREINTYRVDDLARIGKDIWNETLGK